MQNQHQDVREWVAHHKAVGAGALPTQPPSCYTVPFGPAHIGRLENNTAHI